MNCFNYVLFALCLDDLALNLSDYMATQIFSNKRKKNAFKSSQQNESVSSVCKLKTIFK